MNSERHQRIGAIFVRARGLDPEARANMLDEACGDDSQLRAEVESLLEADDHALELDRPFQVLVGRKDAVPRGAPPSSAVTELTFRNLVSSNPSQPGRFLPGMLVGDRYRLVRLLGRGGMGVVYEARQERPQRRVALKVINPGVISPQALRRFELEADILGRLQHPGIARIYEAGTHDWGGGAQPFFAMEFIEGEPLTDFADKRKLGARQRLELVAKVCEGVQHAHQKGIIHRDLKPANVLVDASGQPKILDFGVARATDSDIQTTTRQTDMGQLVGTVPYMSPEQAGGDPNDLDARSDVYALGVVTYELLTSRLPHELRNKMVLDAVRVIREDDPTPLSSINRVFRGDVEIMVGKALAKEKERRYQSALEFASDIQRYLSDQPIIARPPSAMYHLRKFAKRNRVLVGGVAATLLMLIAGAAGTSWQAVKATRQRNLVKLEAERAKTAEAQQRRAREEAEKALDKAEAINEFVTRALVSSDPFQGGAQGFLVADAMEQAIELLNGGELKDQPETEADLRLTIAQILGGNARSDEARRLALRLAERALEINKQLHPGDHLAVVKSLQYVAQCLGSLHRPAKALPKCEAALDMAQRLFEGDHPAVAESLNLVAGCLGALRRPGEALPKIEAALEMTQRQYEGDHDRVAQYLNNLGQCLRSLGRPAEALPKFEAALEMTQRLFEGDHPYVAHALNSVGHCLRSLDRSAEALPMFEAALEMRQRIFEGDRLEVAQSLKNVADCLQALGRLEEALPKYEAALEMNQRLYGGDHPKMAVGLNNVADCLQSLGRSAEALPKYEAALDMFRRVRRAPRSRALNAQIGLAKTLVSLGRYADAEPLLLDAAELCERFKACRRVHWRNVLEVTIQLYDTWHVAEPNAGYDREAAKWRTEFPDASSQPAASPPTSAG